MTLQSSAFQRLFESAPGLYLVLTPDLRIEAASDAYLAATMTTRAAIVGRPLFEVFPDNPADAEATGERNLRASLERVRSQLTRDTMALQRYDVRLPAADGGHFQTRYWQPTNTPVIGPDNQLEFILHSVVDVTDVHEHGTRDRLEDRVRTSEARWRSVIQSAVDGIIIIDARGRIEAFNPAAERLFGYSEAEVIGTNISALMPSPYREAHDSYLAKYLETGARTIIGVGREVHAQRRDGTTVPVHLSVGEMVINGERKFTGILHDLRERVAIEARLREQEALARLGEMAAVIAHEIRNPLAGIRGAVQVIGSRLPASSPDAAIMAEIVQRIDGLGALMKDLLLFARPPQPRPVMVDVAGLVLSTAALLATDPFLRGIDVRVQGSVPDVQADPELLKVVFVNLLMNAAQAMDGHGQILVSVTPALNRCQVAVADQGPGIPSELREKVFTPFFTTKHRGTGLGLPTAKRLVEAHAGQIAIECPPGGGTTVRVSLPM